MQCQSFVSSTPLNLQSTKESGKQVCNRLANSSPAHAAPKMIIDPSTVGTGFALLNSFKGIVIGPTVTEITAAIAGGTVGVMGTIITLELQRQRVKHRKQCPYCRGTGKLPCASCYTIGAVPSRTALTAQEVCTCCNERGFLQCNHVRINFSLTLYGVCHLQDRH